jgi:hypothetical protein
VKPAISLTRAMSDDAIFGRTFGAASFWTWKVLAKVIDGQEMTEARELELFRACTGRTGLPNRKNRRALRRVILLAGRRAGKDRFLSAVAVWRAALCADWSKHVSVGEQAVVSLLARDRRQTAILRRYAEGLLKAPLLAAEIRRRTDDAIEFRNDGVLEIATNDVGSIRGRSAVAVLGSETCYWRTDENAASNDEEVVGAAEPSMAMCPDGGLLILGSSVYRKRGYMYRQFARLHGNEETDDLCWFATSATMNPKLPASVIADALANDAPKARAEYENIWREDVDDFLPLDVIEAATDWGLVERPPELGMGIRYVAAADAASGTGRDSFALAVGHAVNDDARTVTIDLVRERKPRFVAADVIKEFAEILRRYGISEVVSDRYSAGFAEDEWARNGVRFRACDNSTAENFLFALPLLTSKRGRLTDDATVRKQLSGLQRRVVSGHEVVGHAQTANAHDDLAAAVCACLVEAATRVSVCELMTPEVAGSIIQASLMYRSSRHLQSHHTFGGGEREQLQIRRARDQRFR